MRVLYIVATGAGDTTKASVAVHLAVNGSIEAGHQIDVVLAGDGTEWAKDAAVQAAEGLGVPPMRDLFAKLKQHEVPVFV